jgi:hypothetical protein
MPMSFHRTERNRVYAKESDTEKVISGLAVEHARRALGVGCVRMIEVFPDLEATLDKGVLQELKDSWRS